MKTVKLNEILSIYDSPALTAILTYWKDYKPETIIMAYAELKRRNYGINERLLNKLKAFCEKNNQPDIDNSLNEFLLNNQCNSFEEYIEKMGYKMKCQTEKTVKTTSGERSSIDNTKEIRTRYPVLRGITGIYKFFAWITGIVTIIVAIYFITQGGFGLIISLISIIIGSLIVLGLFAIAESIKVFIDIEFNTRKASKK